MNFLRSRKIIVLSIIIIILGLVGCNNNQEENNQEELDVKAPEEVIMTGLEELDVKLTVHRVKELEEVNKDVIAVSSSGEETEMNVSGGLLEELLKEYGKSQTDFSQIRFVASDGYSINVPSSILNNRDIVLAYEINGEPLNEEHQPLRIIIPEERAMYWVSSLSEIEFIGKVKEEIEEDSIKEIVFLETAIKDINIEDYEGGEKAIKVKDLLNKYGNTNDEEIYIKAVDGLEKFENNKVFNDAYIKITGINAPMLTGPDMPEGMTVKNILLFNNGEQSFVSLDGFREVELIEMEEIIAKVNLIEDENVLITDINGEKYNIKFKDLKTGKLYMGEEEKIDLHINDLEENIENVLSIQVRN